MPPTSSRAARSSRRLRFAFVLSVLVVLLSVGVHTTALYVRSLVIDPDDAKIALTVRSINYWVDEAYPSWRADHPGATCPGSLDELGHPPGLHGDLIDAWGRDYRFACDTLVRTNAPTVLIRSPGPDRTLGTEDDLDPRTSRTWHGG